MVYYKCKAEDIGKTLMELLSRDNIMLHDTPCGGKGKCGKCLIKAEGKISPPQENELLLLKDTRSQYRLACLARAEGDFYYEIPNRGRSEILTDFERELSLPKNADLLAVDIGTTTVAVYRIKDGAMTKHSFINPQRRHGADVISRLAFAADGGRELLKEELCSALEEFGPCEYCVICANTVIEHFLTGEDSSAIAKLPFKPASLFGCEYPLPFAEKCYIAPCVAAYVGGDITCGAVAVGMDRVKELTLYIDIGTNGEILLADENRALCCAAAAGPAFEGANIQCGCTAVEGAISKVWYDNGLNFETVAGKDAVGICGSGLIDTAAALLDCGLLDEGGRLEEEKYFFTDDVFISQKDIRALQLAKSAIGAGIKTLLFEFKKNVSDIKRVIIAGGFGMHIDPQSAKRIGLIPSELEARIDFLGNCAGLGAVNCALSPLEREKTESFAKKLEYIELSGHKKFNELYIEEMMFE